MSKKLSIIILGRNVEGEIIPAFKTSHFADEIIYVDTNTGSTDKTLKYARKYAHKIVKSPGYNFAKWRNDGTTAATGEWLLYLDSDERIPPELAVEVTNTINKQTEIVGYDLKRYEIFLGRHLDHWGDPWVFRLIKKSALVRWEGKLHEQPKVVGKKGRLKNQLIHLSHKNMDEKLQSTFRWSKLEAQMLFDAKHPPMKWWRFPRIMATEFWQRCFVNGLWRDGLEGWIEIIYQVFSRYLTYVRLWELQRNPSLKETYRLIDKKIIESLNTDK